MAERKKVMNAAEMEQWLANKGAVPVTKEIKNAPWYKQLNKLPPCLRPEEVAEAPASYHNE